MLKPVSILALDEGTAALAVAVQERIAKTTGLEDLVQARRVEGELAKVIQSIHAQRQRPDSPLRLRDDVSARELVLLVLSAAGPARTTVIDTARELRQLYEMLRLAAFFSVEVLCLLPEVGGGDYAAAYGLLKALSGTEPRPFDEVWLLDSTNGNRVRFGSLEQSLHTYADAVAGMLTLEPEMSGALPGVHPRGMPPVFSSFGYARLEFARDRALQRLAPRFAAELVQQVLLRASEAPSPSLQTKQFIGANDFTIDSAQSLFKRFQPKTLMTTSTPSADDVIAAVRRELQVHRDSTQLQNLEALAQQGDQKTSAASTHLSKGVDELLDKHNYDAAIGFLDALVDPLPDLRADADVAPRNLVTEIHSATVALDERLAFAPNTAASAAARKRVRELENLLQDQQLVADTHAPVSAAAQFKEIESEKNGLLKQLPELLFAEETQNNFSRNAARDSEAARLAAETEAQEQHLRELAAQKPRAEETLREARELRRIWLWRQVLWAAVGTGVIYGVPYALDLLLPWLRQIHWVAGLSLGLFALLGTMRYVSEIAPRVNGAREALERLLSQIQTTDRAKNAAHNAELQFEYEVTQRRTALSVLRRTRDLARQTLAALRSRREELLQLARWTAPAPVVSEGLVVHVVDDADVDAWYERTAEDRKLFVREFPISRSASRQLTLDALQAQITAFAETAFESVRNLTIAEAAGLADETSLAQRMRRFASSSAPLIELRDDDLPAGHAMQRDATTWLDPNDSGWRAQLQKCFPEAQVVAATDPLAVHVVTRVLHYPGYVLGQLAYYRAQYEAAGATEFADVPDLIPADLALTGTMRTAYEQVLLGCAVGAIEQRADGQLTSGEVLLGTSHLAAAARVATSDDLRAALEIALAPRLSIAREVEQDLRALLDSREWPPLDRGLLGGLMKRYALA